jgi:[acyl-carrier-protein] S-malonyltransferase
MPQRVCWLFPGQGSQTVGMGRALADRYPSAARTFAEANEALGFDLRALCWQGPAEELDRTANAQPGLLSASIAALRATAEAAGLARASGRAALAEPLAVAGHSLGEFTAVTAAGALAFADALRLVRRRGELMQAADPAGGMAAVLGLEAEAVAQAIADTGAVVANENAPGQVVVSGPKDALVRAAAALTAIGAKRVLELRVSAAFHSPAMRSVAPQLAEAIAAMPFAALRYPVITNVDADVHEHARELPALLERQVWSPVRWAASMRRAASLGADVFVEFGPGAVLTGLAKRILPGARTASVSDPASLEEALTVLR